MIKLSPKRERFAQEWVVDLNATQAAIRAGYSEKTAKQQGSRLLTNADVAARVKELQGVVAEKIEITQDMVAKELASIGFSDPRDVMSWGPAGVLLRQSSELTRDQAITVSEVTETKTKDGGSIKLKFHDKPKALINYGKHIGMWPTKIEHTGKDGEPLIKDNVDRARRALFAMLLAKHEKESEDA